MIAIARRRLTGIAVWAVPIAALTYLVATIIGPIRPAHLITSYPQVSPALATLDVSAGLGLFLVGATSWIAGRRGVGLLALLAGVCWMGPDWAGYGEAPLSIRATGLLLGALTLPVMAHLVVRAVRSDDRPVIRAGLVAGYLALGIGAIAWLVLYVPTLDARCLAMCDEGPLTELGDHHLASEVARTLDWLTIVVATGLGAWSGLRLVRSALVRRRHEAPVLLPAVAVGVTWAMAGVGSLQPSVSTPPTGSVMVTVFVLQALAVLSLSAGIGWMLLAERRILRAVKEICYRLSPLPGGESLRGALAAAVGDPGLRLLFPVADGSGLVDTSGAPVDRPSHRVVPIEGDDGRVVALAALSHDLPDEQVVRALGPAVRLAADNERLLAAVRHEVLELRDSRRRIVETADAARQRLERDLHDGAQQRMLAVLYELALARDAAAREGEGDVAEKLAIATRSADAATEALRHIARGLYDPVLTEAGLAAALEAFAVDAPIPVEFRALGTIACGPEAEATAWGVASGAVEQAARAGARAVSSILDTEGDNLRLRLDIEGLADLPDLIALEDRVGAAGGRLWLQPSGTPSLGLTVTLPCA